MLCDSFFVEITVGEDAVAECTLAALEYGIKSVHWIQHLVHRYRLALGLSQANYADDAVAIRAALREVGG